MLAGITGAPVAPSPGEKHGITSSNSGKLIKLLFPIGIKPLSAPLIPEVFYCWSVECTT